MDDVYKDFWKDGERVYPASADSVKVYPGHNRIELAWWITGDPSVNTAKIFWNNGKDVVEVPLQREEGSAYQVKTMLTDMPEGFYLFDIYLYDDRGNSSMKVSTVGTVYGDSYISFLINKPVTKALMADGILEITWGSPVDGTSLGSELLYTDVSGNTRNTFVAPDAVTTVLTDYDFEGSSGSIRYRTKYKPVTTAIDTFYTAYDTAKVIGPAVPYVRTGWTATASSFKAGNGPEKMIDNDPVTFWLNQSGASYPFIITVDLNAEIDLVEGFFLQQRTTLANPHVKSFELEISLDGIEWESMGLSEAADHMDVQYFDFPAPQRLRYFRMTCYTTYGDKPNCTLAEVGLYHR